MCTSNGLHDCSVSLFLMDRVIDRFIAENQQTKSISLCNLKPSFDGWSKICDLIAGNNEVVELQFEVCFSLEILIGLGMWTHWPFR